MPDYEAKFRISKGVRATILQALDYAEEDFTEAIRAFDRYKTRLAVWESGEAAMLCNALAVVERNGQFINATSTAGAIIDLRFALRDRFDLSEKYVERGGAQRFPVYKVMCFEPAPGEKRTAWGRGRGPRADEHASGCVTYGVREGDSEPTYELSPVETEPHHPDAPRGSQVVTMTKAKHKATHDSEDGPEVVDAIWKVVEDGDDKDRTNAGDGSGPAEGEDHWEFNDGGRKAAGYKGRAGDCVTRAIAIATGLPYQSVYDDLKAQAKRERPRGGSTRSSVRDGVKKATYKRYVNEQLGLPRTATMQIGSGCQVHLTADELPPGRLIVQVSGHLCAVVDGVIQDTHDPSRDGTRCVYGFWDATKWYERDTNGHEVPCPVEDAGPAYEIDEDDQDTGSVYDTPETPFMARALLDEDGRPSAPALGPFASRAAAEQAVKDAGGRVAG